MALLSLTSHCSSVDFGGSTYISGSVLLQKYVTSSINSEMLLMSPCNSVGVYVPCSRTTTPRYSSLKKLSHPDDYYDNGEWDDPYCICRHLMALLLLLIHLGPVSNTTSNPSAGGTYCYKHTMLYVGQCDRPPITYHPVCSASMSSETNLRAFSISAHTLRTASNLGGDNMSM